MILMFEKFFNKKAQSSIEYLLIIGGALLVAVIAITIIVSLGKSNNETVGDNQQDYQELVDNQIMIPLITDVECSTTQIIVYTSGSVTEGVVGYKYSLDGAAFIDTPALNKATGSITIPLVLGTPIAIGEIHEIRLVAIKNNARSVPTIQFNCTVR